MSDGAAPIDHLSGWPPPFAPAFVDDAVDLLELHGAVSIVGPPGAHRLSLAAAIADRRGRPRYVLRCRHAQRRHDHGLTRALLHEVLGTDAVADDELVETISTSLRSSADPADRLPTVILADAEFSDAQSRRDLERLVRSHVVRVVVLLAQASAHRHSELLNRTGVVHLQALDYNTVGAAVSARFGFPIQPEAVQFLLSRSEGNYGVLQELATYAIQTGRISEIEGVLVLTERSRLEVPTRLGTVVRPRSSVRLDLDESADLVDLVALVHEVDEDEAIDCVGEKCVKSAIKHGVVVATDGAIRLASAPEAEWIVLAMPEQRQHDLHRRFGRRLERSIQRTASAMNSVHWLFKIGESPPGEVLHTAMIQANLAGLYTDVIAWTDSSANCSQVAIERAYALQERGERDLTREFLEDVDPSALSDDDLLQFVRMRWVLGLERWPAACEAAFPTSPTSSKEHRARIVELAALIDKTTEFSDPVSAARLTEMTTSGELSTLAHVAVLTALSYSHRSRAEIGQAVAAAHSAMDLIAACETPISATYRHLAHEALILSLMTSMDYEATRDALHEYTRDAARAGSSIRFGHGLWAFFELIHGDIGYVLARSQSAVDTLVTSDPHLTRSWMEAHLSQALAQAGRMTDAKEHLAKSLSLPVPRRLQMALEARIAQACAMDSTGDPEAALAHLDAIHDEARDHGLRLNQIDAAVLRVQIGGQMYLPPLLEAVEPLTNLVGTPAVWKQFAESVSSSDCRTLMELTQQLSKAGAAVISAEIAQYVVDRPVSMTKMSPQELLILEGIADPMAHGSH